MTDNWRDVSLIAILTIGGLVGYGIWVEAHSPPKPERCESTSYLMHTGGFNRCPSAANILETTVLETHDVLMNCKCPTSSETKKDAGVVTKE